jgi:hypothetical protein
MRILNNIQNTHYFHDVYYTSCYFKVVTLFMRNLFRVRLPYLLIRRFYYRNACMILCFIIISVLMSPLLGHRPALWVTHKENGL